MRKFWAILCIIAMMTVAVAPAAPVMAADPYEFDGDIVDNPWAELFTTAAEDETTAAVETTTVAVETTTVAAETTTVATEETTTVDDSEYAGLTWKQVGTSNYYVAAGNNDFPFQLLEDQGTQMLIIPSVATGNKPIWPDFTNVTFNGEAFDQAPGAGIYVQYSLLTNTYNVFEATSAVDGHTFQILIKVGAPAEVETTEAETTEERTTSDNPYENCTWYQVGTSNNYVASANDDFPFQLIEDQGTQMLLIPSVAAGNKPIWPDFTNVTINGEPLDQLPGAGIYIPYSVLEANSYNVYEATSAIDNHVFQIYIKTGDLEAPTEAPTAAETTTVADDQPTAPEGLTYAGNATNPYYFAWSPVETAVSYNFYVDGVLVGSNTETNFNATADVFPAVGEYVVGVTAVNEAGIESPMSTIVYAVEPETTTAEGDTVAVPSAPLGLTYSGNADLPYHFAWAPSVGATSYNVYVNGELAGNSTVENFEIPVAFFPATGDYEIGVTAVNDTGESAMTVITYTVEEVITEVETTTVDPSIPTAVEGLTWAGNELQPYWFAWAAAENAVSYNFYINGVLVNTDVNPWFNASVKLFPEIGDYEITVTYVTAEGVESAEATIVYTVTEVIEEDPTEAPTEVETTTVVEETTTVVEETTTVVEETTTVSEELAIVSQPGSVTVPAGSSASLSIEATGKGLTYSWEMSKDGGLTWAKSTVDGYKTNSINFVATEAYHGRQYRCIVTDANGETVVSEPGTVLIEELVSELVITSQPKSVTVANGGKGVMTVGAIGNGLTYQWEMSSDGGQTWATSSVDGCKTARIEFIVTEAYHGRQYRCVVKDENGNEVASEAGVVVSKELENSLMITSHPKTVIIPNGTKGKMTVGAMGEGLTYQWEMSKDGGQTWTTSSVDGCHTARIEFTATTAYHGRQYRCVVTDANGEQAISNGGVVVVKELENDLMITTHPKTVTVAKGAKGKMTVGAMGKGLTYQWEMSKDAGLTWATSSVDGCHTNKIEFTATDAYHGRLYRCVITDENGESVISVGGAVVVEEYADTLKIIVEPSDVAVAAGTSTSVSFSAIGVGLTYQWEMSKDGGATWTKSTVDGYNTNTIKFTATSAYNGRQYRCVVKDAEGNTVTTRGTVITVQ